MCDIEEVNDNEAKNLANELNAIFLKTSAKSSNGIEELFIEIGKKFLSVTISNDKNNQNSVNKKIDFIQNLLIYLNIYLSIYIKHNILFFNIFNILIIYTPYFSIKKFINLTLYYFFLLFY